MPSTRVISLSAPIGERQEIFFTVTNTGTKEVTITTSPGTRSATYRTQPNFLHSSDYTCGIGPVVPNETCIYSVLFQPGTDKVQPQIGDVYHATFVIVTDQGRLILRITTTVT